MKFLKTLILAILAGFSIGLGATAFLACDNKIVGSFLFTLGLFLVCSRGYNLFTGKVGYIFDNKPSYISELAIIWLGNLIGTACCAGLILLTRVGHGYSEKASEIIDTKLSGSFFSVFVLAIFCNILMYIGVDGFKTNPHVLGKYLGLFFAVVIFLLAGFEHCVANMFYITVAERWSGETVLLLLVSTAGNIVGGVIFPLLQKAAAYCEKEVKKND